MKTNQRLLIDFVSIIGARGVDLVCTIVAAVFAYYIRFLNIDLSDQYKIVTLVGALLISFSASTFDVYVSWRGKSYLSLFSRLVVAWCVAYGLLLGGLVFVHQADYFSRLWLGYWMCLGLGGVIAFRVLVYYLMGQLREKGVNHRRLLVVGTGCVAQGVINRLREQPWVGMDVVRVVPNGKPFDEAELCGVRVKGSIQELDDIAREDKVDEVWICLPLKEGDFVDRVLYELRHSTANIRFVPDLSDFRLLNHKATEVAGVYALDLSCSPLDGVNHYLKSLEDRLLGVLIFCLVLPLLALIALGVKLSSRGPILFKQRRHGLDGRPINVYKFRTMKVHSEGGVTQAVKGDPRVTRFGSFLRKTSLDELPQFFNVLQGKMSIVGPRPHAIAHNEQYKDLVESYMKRHKVKPGITGWAQINGYRGETDTVDKMRKRVEYDLFYIENWSIVFDLKIIVLTLFKGFVNKNAY